MLALRQGECPNCPHDVIDSRDLKYFRNVCGYSFRPEDDAFQWRGRLGLARHGLGEILIFSLVCFALLGGLWTAFAAGMPGWLFLILKVALLLFWIQIIAFFRDPERQVPADPAVLVSPADGTITDFTEMEEPGFPGGKALRVGIFLSVFNVHVNRSPRAGRVVRVQYRPGRFFDARREDAITQNEQMWIDLEEVDSGRLIRVKQISGAIARRIVCWLKAGDVLEKGQRIGMIKFGSRTEVYIPADSGHELAVRIGEKVKGGETVLLRFRK